MNKKSYLVASVIAISLFTANASWAAFPIKAHVETIAATRTASPEVMTAFSPAASTEAGAALADQSVVSVKKHSFFSRVVSLFTKPGHASISQILYIILAILPFGWLGMGLNDNFSGSDWVISLILYILMWLPGFIWTMIKMSKYY